MWRNCYLLQEIFNKCVSIKIDDLYKTYASVFLAQCARIRWNRNAIIFGSHFSLAASSLVPDYFFIPPNGWSISVYKGCVVRSILSVYVALVDCLCLYSQKVSVLTFFTLQISWLQSFWAYFSQSQPPIGTQFTNRKKKIVRRDLSMYTI